MDDLGPSERVRLVSRFGRPFTAGEVLFREGEHGGEALLLQEGRVRLLKRVRGVERSLMVLRPGDLFGESALVPGSPRTSTAIALTEGLALTIEQGTLQNLLETHPGVANKLVHQLVRRLRDAEDQIELMMLRDGQSKIISALLKAALASGAPQSGAIKLNLSPMDLSSRVGLDMDTVRAGVSRLRDKQYLRLTGDKLEILDVEALRKLFGLLGTKDQISSDPGDGAAP